MRTLTPIPTTKHRPCTTCRRKCKRCTAARRCNTCTSMRTRSNWPRTCLRTAPRPPSCQRPRRCAIITRHDTTRSPTTPRHKVLRHTPPPPPSHTALTRTLKERILPYRIIDL